MCFVSGSDCAMSSPWMYMPRKLPSTAASSMLGMRSPGSGSRSRPIRLRRSPAPRGPRRDGSPAVHAGSCPCRSFPARCSDHAAGSPRRRGGRYCRSPSPGWRSPSPRCCPGCARSRPARNRSRRCRRWRTAAPRRGPSSAGTPVTVCHRLRAVARLGDERRPVGERLGIAALARRSSFVHQALGHDHMRQRGQHRDIGARTQRQMVRRLDMRRAHQVDAPRIDDDQLRALRAAAASCARRTPDAHRSDWRRSP